MKTRVNFIFSNDLIARIRKAAALKDQTMSEFVRRAIIAALDKMKL